MEQPKPGRTRRLIEEWLPIAEIGIESVRERTPMTPFPAPNRLHVWWARRPLVASRAAILASLLPADADRAKFLHMLGIHGDPVAAKVRIAEATRQGVRLGKRNLGRNPTAITGPSPTHRTPRIETGCGRREQSPNSRHEVDGSRSNGGGREHSIRGSPARTEHNRERP